MTAKNPAQAVENGHAVGWYDSGMCQKFVRDQCWRVPSLYGSAIDAWNGARWKHPGDRNPPKGAPMYYRGGQYGHAVIRCHGGMRSTDCHSSGDVSDDELNWPEKAWGYVYLGWTEDINGVRVITPGGEEDMPLSNEDLEKIAKAVWNFGLAVYDTEADDEKPAKVIVSQTHTRAGKAAGYKGDG